MSGGRAASFAPFRIGCCVLGAVCNLLKTFVQFFASTEQRAFPVKFFMEIAGEDLRFKTAA